LGGCGSLEKFVGGRYSSGHRVQSEHMGSCADASMVVSTGVVSF
jgi:hypothetical protein